MIGVAFQEGARPLPQLQRSACSQSQLVSDRTTPLARVTAAARARTPRHHVQLTTFSTLRSPQGIRCIFNLRSVVTAPFRTSSRTVEPSVPSTRPARAIWPVRVQGRAGHHVAFHVKKRGKGACGRAKSLIDFHNWRNDAILGIAACMRYAVAVAVSDSRPMYVAGRDNVWFV